MNRRLPARVIRRSVIVLGLIALVALVVGAIELLAHLASTRPDMWAWLGGAAAIALLVPLVGPALERLADRAAHGREGDPYAVLAGFVQRISETLAVDDVLPYLARTAAQATRSTSGAVRLWLSDGEERHETWPPQAEVDEGSEVGVMLLHGGERVGRLDVAAADETLRESDRELLNRLAGPAGVALSNVKLTLELRRQLIRTRALSEQIRLSRQRLLDSQREQQERFVTAVQRRVVTHLDAVDAQLGSLGDGMSSLAEVESHTLASLEALRELAAGLFPPVLAQRGLAAALRWHFDRHGEPVDVSDELGADIGLPVAVESAAYFCCVAVCDDIADKAPASITLSGSEAGLTFGIRSTAALGAAVEELLRDRVEALGGELVVAFGADGCDIRARLDVQAGVRPPQPAQASGGPSMSLAVGTED